ncbi:MAG TPA: hypothetical protein VHB99_08860 [Pirellulales bacterium]|nr:hypothetical protein [Pirellulales bacterium]
MRRRFQFSLRALLGLAAGVCLLLGGKHLLETYGQRIEVEQPVVGKPIKIRARYIRLFGPSDVLIFIDVVTSTGREEGWAEGAGRSWLCCYETETEIMKPVKEPCQLELTMGEITEWLPPNSEGLRPPLKKTVKHRTLDVKY